MFLRLTKQGKNMAEFGTKKYEKEMYRFFKKNGGKGCEYNGWWYLQGVKKIEEVEQEKVSKKIR